MKKVLSSFDVYFMVKELQVLLDARLDKIYQDKEHFLFMSHVPGKGKKMLSFYLPDLVFVTEHKQEFDQASGFAQFLRKYLSKGRIRSVEQVGFERVIKIDIELKERTVSMYVELFSTGNIILCDEKSVIFGIYKTANYKDRTLRGGVEYQVPRQEYDVLSLSFEEFNEAIAKSDKESIVKTLALLFGLGGVYAEEVCLRAQVDKDLSKVTVKHVTALFDVVQDLKQSPVRGYVVKKDDTIKDISPLLMKRYDGFDVTEYESFSLALDSIITVDKSQTQHKAKQSVKNTQLTKIQKMIQSQEKQIETMQKEMDVSQRKGELIYENYAVIESLLNQLKEARKSHSWKEIKEHLKDHKIIKSINEKNNELEVEL